MNLPSNENSVSMDSVPPSASSKPSTAFPAPLKPPHFIEETIEQQQIRLKHRFDENTERIHKALESLKAKTVAVRPSSPSNGSSHASRSESSFSVNENNATPLGDSSSNHVQSSDLKISPSHVDEPISTVAIVFCLCILFS